MKRRKVLTATLLALCAVVCLMTASVNVQAQENAQTDSETNLETQLYLIVGTNQDVDATRLPTAVEPVVKQLRATLPFKNYRLAATLINRVKNEGRLDLSWIGGPLASAVPGATAATPSFSQFKVRQVKIVRNSEGQQVVQMLAFNFGARIPIQTSGVVASSGTVPPAFNYENTGLATDISMRESETGDCGYT